MYYLSEIGIVGGGRSLGARANRRALTLSEGRREGGGRKEGNPNPKRRKEEKQGGEIEIQNRMEWK